VTPDSSSKGYRRTDGPPRSCCMWRFWSSFRCTYYVLLAV